MLLFGAFLHCCLSAAAGTWTPLANLAPEPVNLMLLLSDGTVMAAVQPGPAIGSGWVRLTPDLHGSYANGTWSALASMQNSRLYCSTAVLRDGRVFIAGGEYGSGSGAAEIYDPLRNAWTAAPFPGQVFADSISKILPDGSMMVAPVYPSSCGLTVLYDPAANTWSAGPLLLGACDQAEASWVKLADGSILTIDPFGTNSERFIPALNQWVADANVPVAMYDSLGELGAGLLLADGRAFFLGGSGHTALYTPSGNANPGSWTAGPDIPGGLGTPDAPAAMMTSGSILCAVGPAGTYDPPTSFYEYDPAANAFVPETGPTGSTDGVPPFGTAMLDLPDGTVLYSHFGADLYVYRPGGSPLASGKPSISGIVRNADGSYHLTGTLLNGISEGAAYGDDAQMSSSYPIVRLTATGGNVYYGRTFNWSSTGVMTGNTPVSTEFTTPVNLPAGTYSLAAVANGISSDTVSFTQDSLQITPFTNAVSSGPAGGPFTVSSQSYVLTNVGAASLNWSLGNTSSWLSVSLLNGTLAPGGSASLVSLSLNPGAGSLAPGSYSAPVWFTNLASGLAQGRTFNLTVTPETALQPYANLVKLFNPAAYWRLNESNPPPSFPVATNLGSLGSVANGTYAGPFGWLPGALAASADEAAGFDGAGHATVAYLPGLSLSPPFTVEAWIKPAVSMTAGNFACPLACGDFASPRSGWLIYQTPTGWSFRLYNQNGLNTSLDLETSGAPVPGTWYHIAAVYNGTTGSLYVDGNGISASSTGYVPNTDGALTAGERSDGGFGFDGSVDEVAVYTSALSAATLQAHYQNGTNNAPATSYSQLVLSQSPVLYFRMDAPVPRAVAVDSGSLSTNADGLYEPGAAPGFAGPPLACLGANDTSCQFNGMAGYIEVPGKSLNMGGPVSLLAWALLSPGNGTYETIASKGDNSWRLEVDGAGYPHFGDGQSNPEVVGPRPINDGRWHQLAGVYDGSAANTLYVDGALAASTNASASVAGSAGELRIGDAPDYGSARIFNGALDEVAIFTNALTAAQVALLYDGATNTASMFPSAPGFQSLTRAGGTLGFAWSAFAGLRYQLEYKTNLAQPNWINLGGVITATHSSVSGSDSIGPDPQRFYRAVLLP